MSKTVKKASSADAIYNALLDKIEKHYWDPGDRLPAENDLAEEYGVSRVTIRAVLQKLSALGLVETRSGGGTYVSKFNFFSLIQSVSGVMFSNISHSDISVYRVTIESATVDLIAEKPILSKYVRELQNCINRMEKAGKALDKHAFAKEDYNFHLTLCKMTENGMFIFAYELIYSTLIKYFDEHYTIAGMEEPSEPTMYYDDAVKNHQKILDYIVAGKFDVAKAIIQHMASNAAPFSYSDL